MLMARLRKKFIYKLQLYYNIYMPINLGNGLVTGNIVLRTGSGGGGGGGTSVNVPANSILFSSTGTDICGNSGLQYDGNIASSTFLNANYLNGNLAKIGDYYYDSTILLTSLGEDSIIDSSYYKLTLDVVDVSQDYDNIFEPSTYIYVSVFNGLSSYITATNTIFNIGNNGGTIEFMFKFSDTSTVASIFTLGESGDNQHVIGLQANYDSTGNYLPGGLSLVSVTSGWTVNPIWDTSGIDTSKWYYFSLSISNNTSYKVYFGEGYPNNIANEQIILTPTLESYTNPEIDIGASLTAGNYFNGRIANFRMSTIQRYITSNIPIPPTFFPIYNTGLDTRGARFNMQKTGDSELGLFIGADDTGVSDIIIGCKSLTFNTGSSSGNNVIIGNSNIKNITTSAINRNIIIGYNNSSTTINYLNNIYGTNNTLGNYFNCTIIGNSTTVTGSNQNQIGDSGTTTYTYGAVQNRSDLRDKTDIVDIPIGINFIDKLKPKFYRWNYREDYIQRDLSGNIIYDQSGNPISDVIDGSKKRARYHSGLIAQDVKETMDELSIDFGLYQDHLVNGGQDVKTLGYAELIPILIKAVQELSAKNIELENRIKILEHN